MAFLKPIQKLLALCLILCLALSLAPAAFADEEAEVEETVGQVVIGDLTTIKKF